MGDVHDPFLVRFWADDDPGRPRALADGCRSGSAPIALVLALRWLKTTLGLQAASRPAASPWSSMAAAGALAGPRGPGRQGRRRDPGQAAVVRAARPRHARTCAQLSTSALAIATLGLLEAISMAKAIAAQTRQKLDINQQCLSEGPGQPVRARSSSAFPGSGSLTRSSINQQAGARHPVVGRDLGRRRGRHRAGLRALCRVHPASLRWPAS